MSRLILAYPQAQLLLDACAAGRMKVESSADLNLTRMQAVCDDAGVTFACGQVVPWPVLREIAASNVNCFLVEDGVAEKIVRFAESTNRVYSLMPTERAPTMLISGISMHRIKGTDPVQDTREKVKALRPRGHVLDTATGLGYTAVETSKSAIHVTTIEIEPTVLELCRLNPWSQALFDNPKVTQLVGDSYDLIQEFADAEFDGVLHDPPAFGIDGDLYSATVYGEFMRILKPRGRLFHYIGNPNSRSGATVTRGVVRRLQEAGFTGIAPRPQAFGVVARKP